MAEIENSRSSPGFRRKPRGEACAARCNVVRMDESSSITRYAVNNLNHAARKRGDGERRTASPQDAASGRPFGRLAAQYTQVGEFAPTHDRKGNLSGMGQWLYRYDAMNRLVFASNGATTARFWYDAKNRCVARSYQSSGSALLAPSSTLTLNTYDNWNLIEERDGSGAQTARYVHGRKIDEIIVMVNRHGTFYPHHDALGNVTMLTGKDGRLVERYTYSVTGQVAISDASGKTLAESAIGNRWMFRGREWLQEAGLYDFRNRVYSVELGRFLQIDRIRFKGGDINIYRYCFNRYARGSDPLGLNWWDDVKDAIATGGQAVLDGMIYVSETMADATIAAVDTAIEYGSYAADYWSNVADSALTAIGNNAIQEAEMDMASAQLMADFTSAYIDVMGEVGVNYANNFWENASNWQADVGGEVMALGFASDATGIFGAGAGLSVGLVATAGVVGAIEAWSFIEAVGQLYE